MRGRSKPAEWIRAYAGWTALCLGEEALMGRTAHPLRLAGFTAATALGAATFAAPTCFGAAGDVVRQYDWTAEAFVRHPTRPLMYASLRERNSVAIIDTNTLAVRNTVFIGSNPVGMALSPDGGKLFVANVGSNFVGVLDTATENTLEPLLMPSRPWDVEFGLD